MPLKNNFGRSFKNFHENINIPVGNLPVAYNITGGEKWQKYNDFAIHIENLITQYIQEGRSFKTCGSRWSFSDITNNNDTIIDSTNLAIKIDIRADEIHTDYTGHHTDLLFVQCGITIKQISKHLFTKGKSLKTSGASNGQSIAGAMSTGVHGSTIDFGSIQDFIVGINVILNSGKNVYIERLSYPTINDNFAKNFNATKVIRDDEVFNAVLVSFGCTGFIHGVVIEAEKIFGLQTYVEKISYENSLYLMDTLDFDNAGYQIKDHKNTRPWHFKLYINPYRVQNSMLAETIYKVPLPTNYTSPHANETNKKLNNDLLSAIGSLVEKYQGNEEAIVNIMEKLNIVEIKDGSKIHSLADTFFDTTTGGDVFSCSIGIPIKETSKTMTVLNEIITGLGGIPSIYALRFVNKSDALMAFTKFEKTCIFEIDGLRTTKNIKFVQAIPKALKESKIPFTFHWGKYNSLDAKLVKEMYSTNYDKFIEVRSRLMNRQESNVFRGNFTDGLGLGDYVDGLPALV